VRSERSCQPPDTTADAVPVPRPATRPPSLTCVLAAQRSVAAFQAVILRADHLAGGLVSILRGALLPTTDSIVPG